MKSRVISFSSAVAKISYFISAGYEDRLTVYAAQTSFYICISVIPFIILVLSLSRALAPRLVNDVIAFLREVLPSGAREIFDIVAEDASERSTFSIVSITAVATLWGAAKGLTAAVRGISEVYKIRVKGAYFFNIFRGLIFTILYTTAVAVTLLLLVVFEGLEISIDIQLPHVLCSGYKVIVIFVILALFFSLFYYLTAKGSFFVKKTTVSCEAPNTFAEQLLGAVIASAGWILYSFCYSLYFKYYTKSSYIYGSLAAVVFLMLWIYFCSVIFLFGAEVNKALYLSKSK